MPFWGKKKEINKETKEAIEVYRDKRFFTVTGEVFNQSPIQERGRELQELIDKYFPKPQPHFSDIPRTGGYNSLETGLKNDKLLRALWNGQRNSGDESANDMAFMNKLA